MRLDIAKNCNFVEVENKFIVIIMIKVKNLKCRPTHYQHTTSIGQQTTNALANKLPMHWLTHYQHVSQHTTTALANTLPTCW